MKLTLNVSSKILENTEDSTSCKAKSSTGLSSKSSSESALTTDVPTLLSSRHGGFFIELTLGMPRTAAFVSWTSSKQCSFYNEMVRKIRHCMMPNIMLDLVDIGYEVNSDTHFHCHALLSVNDAKAHFPLGVIGDIAKTWFNTIKVARTKFDPKHVYGEFQRYRAPSITVQYKNGDDIAEYQRFLDYLRKYK